MEWTSSLVAPYFLSLVFMVWRQFYFGAGRFPIQTAINKLEFSSAHLPELLLSRISLLFSESFQLLFPSLWVLLSSLLAASAYVWPHLQSGGSSTDWIQTATQLATLVGSLVAVFISIKGYRKIDSEIRKTGAEAKKTEADANKTIADTVDILLKPMNFRIEQLTSRITFLEKENEELKAENRALTKMVIALGGQPFRKE